MTERTRLVRAARAYSDMPQTQMAAALGVSLATYKRIEGDRPDSRDAYDSELKTIAEVTGVSLDFLHRGFTPQGIGQPFADALDRYAQITAALTECCVSLIDLRE